MTNAHSDTCSAADSARAALAEIRRFTRATARADQIPADTSGEIADLAALVAALPQALSHLSGTLARALVTQTLTLDSMAEETEAATAVRVARLHLEQAASVLADTQEHLHAAHNATAHLVSGGIQHDRDQPW